MSRRSSGNPRMSTASSNTRASQKPGSATNIKGPLAKSSALAQPKAGGGKPEFNLPPYSILSQTRKYTAEEMDRLRKKTRRRNAPACEDLPQIKKIIAGLKGQDTSVQEFVSLVAPYTGDNGKLLRQVLQEDLTQFRKLARKVYETMTQDVSDVLTNEQVDLMEYYKDRKAHMQDRMMRAINEIFEMVPDFDFEKYDRDKNAYLLRVLPIKNAADSQMNEEDLEMQRRQEAYHRLQWLRSEGERLNEENNRLQARLNELKELQKTEQVKAVMREEAAARKREELEETQEQMQGELERLSESMEKSIVDNETAIRKQADTMEMPSRRRSTAAGMSSTGLARKRASTGKFSKRPEWNSSTAVDIEQLQAEQSRQGEVSKLEASVRSSSSKGKAVGGRRKDSVLQTTVAKAREIKTEERRKAPGEKGRSSKGKDDCGCKVD